MPLVTTLAAGAVFGLALAAPPGPMNAIIAEESVRRGWSAGFRAGLGAMTADAVFFGLAFVGVVSFVERLPTLRGLMVGAGGLLMLYFAYGAAVGVEETFSGAETPDEGAGRGFQKAFVLALTNPYQILFWLTIGVGMLDPGRLDVLARVPVVGADLAGWVVVETGTPALVVGFFGGILLWIGGFPAALVGAERRVDAVAPAVAAASALILAGFGIAFIADAAGLFLG